MYPQNIRAAKHP